MVHEHLAVWGGNIFYSFIRETLDLWLSVAPYLLLGMFIAGVLHVFLGKDFISRHLGQGGIWSILKATLIGVPLPVCSCGVIPLASSLEKDGAHKSSVLAFLVSTPTTGIDSIMATYSLMGPLFAIFRPIASFFEGLILGMVHYLSGGYKEKTRLIPAHVHQPARLSFKIREVFRYAFYETPQDLGKWLILGTVLGGLISAAIPREIFSKYFVFPFDFIVALAVGIPLYVCATGSIPIAVSLMAKGFSPGAALVFLIGGPATNAITLSFVRVKFGKKAFYLYLGTIIVVAVILGLLFNWLWGLLGRKADLITGAGSMLPFEVRLISAVFLFLLVVYALLKSKPATEMVGDLVIKVPDIHCQHCQITLEENLGHLPGIEKVQVDVAKKTVKIKGTVEKEKVLEKIKESGYTPEQ